MASQHLRLILQSQASVPPERVRKMPLPAPTLCPLQRDPLCKPQTPQGGSIVGDASHGSSPGTCEELTGTPWPCRERGAGVSSGQWSGAGKGFLLEVPPSRLRRCPGQRWAPGTSAAGAGPCSRSRPQPCTGGGCRLGPSLPTESPRRRWAAGQPGWEEGRPRNSSCVPVLAPWSPATLSHMLPELVCREQSRWWAQ